MMNLSLKILKSFCDYTPFIVLSLMMTSCSFSKATHNFFLWKPKSAIEAQSVRKIEDLREELTAARHDLKGAQKRVDYFTYRYYKAEVSFIRGRVVRFEKNLPNLQADEANFQRFLKKDLPTFFKDEREVLSKIIDDNEVLQQEAHIVLDQILHLITVLNEQEDIGIDKESQTEPPIN